MPASRVQPDRLAPLHPLMIEPLIRAALLEDWGRAGDVTSQAVIPAQAVFKGVITARQEGLIAGLDVAALAFTLTDPAIQIEFTRCDGEAFQAQDVVMCVEGPARAILSAERVALNLLCRMTGIATATAALVTAARPYGPARIACTRKTTPGLRALEKYAVRAGGGYNHRFGLDDAVLIKDNHITVAGGVRAALQRAKDSIGHLVKIEIEIDRLDQLEEALASGADVVLLDNMPLEILTQAVAMAKGHAITEASGRVKAETIGPIAATGVDIISVGWLTHSAPIIDLGLDV
jgi:nicotinate-nucleotide pyrophosphorylase (carboxylating)